MVFFYLMVLSLALISGRFLLWKVPVVDKNPAGPMVERRLSIIIPARNEENNLPILLKSIKRQSSRPFEVIVVDDDSKDETAKIAKEFGALVFQLNKEDMSWFGKSAACFYGAEFARGDWLLFLDADTYFPDSKSLGSILEEFQKAESKAVVSVQPFHVIEKTYENFSVLFNILVLTGMNRFSFFQEKMQPAGAFGPSLLVERETYFKVGGHERVKESIMENIALGKLFMKAGFPVHLYGGKGVLHFRMYSDGMRDVSKGWSKSFASASGATHPLILAGVVLWIAGAFVSFFFVVYALIQGNAGLMLLAAAGYFLYFVQFYKMAQLAGNFHWSVLFFYPVFFFYFVLLFIWSLIKTRLLGSVSWKGRKIEMREPGDAD